MTIHTTIINNRVFYINKTKDNSINYNSVNEKTGRTFHYKNAKSYYIALTKAKQF